MKWIVLNGMEWNGLDWNGMEWKGMELDWFEYNVQCLASENNSNTQVPDLRIDLTKIS